MAQNKQDTLNRLWVRDARVAPWKNTAWGVLQAVNTYGHHEQTVRSATRDERNMLNAINGITAKADNDALDLLGRSWPPPEIMSKIAEKIVQGVLVLFAAWICVLLVGGLVWMAVIEPYRRDQAWTRPGRSTRSAPAVRSPAATSPAGTSTAPTTTSPSHEKPAATVATTYRAGDRVE